jgi:hypothetical protein
MSSRKTVLVVTGSLFALVAMGLLIAGGVLTGISETRSDPDGYWTSPTFELSTDTHALTSEQLDLGVVRNDWLPASWLATVKVSAASLGDVPVFVGIAAEAEVDAYLADVAHSEVTWNSDDDPVYLSREGENAPGVPAEQDFWMTSSEGLDPQSIVWDVEPGRWTVLIMNADATREVTVDVSAGVRTPWLIIVAVGLLGAGTLCLVTGSVLIVFGLRRRPATQQGAPTPGTSEEPTVTARAKE